MLIRSDQACVLRVGGLPVGALRLDASPAVARVNVSKTSAGLIRIDIIEKPADDSRVLLLLPGPRIISVGVEGVTVSLSSLTSDPAPAGLHYLARAESGPFRTIEYLDLTDFEPEPPATFAWGTPALPVISFPSGAQVGGTLAVAAAAMSNADSVSYTLQRLLSSVWTDYVTLTALTYTLPAELAGFSVRVRQRATGFNGTITTTFDAVSAASETITVNTGGVPPIATAYMSMISEYRSGGEYGTATYFSPVLTFAIPNVTIGVGGAEAQWTTSASADPPANNVESIAAHPTLTGKFRPVMTTAASNGDITPSRLDYAVFLDTEETRRARFRWRYRTSASGQWSPWSANYAVPLPVVAPAAAGSVPTQEVALSTAATVNFADYFTGQPITLTVSPTGPTISGMSITFAGRATEGSDSWTVTATNTAGTATQSVTRTAATTPTPALGTWRQVIMRPPNRATNTPNFPDNYAAGEYWGEGLQFQHSVDREANVVVTTGDMNGARVSRNGGASWGAMGGVGMLGCAGQGIKIDPSNTQIMVAAVSMWRYATSATLQGAIVRTTDGGATWTVRQEFNRTIINPRCPVDTIVCHPVTGGSNASRSFKFLEWTDANNGFTTSDTPRLWVSSNGGVDWTLKSTPFSFGADYYQLVQDPNDVNKMFVCSSSGLWFTDDNGDEWTKVANGLSATGDFMRMWIDPNNSNRQLVTQYSTSGSGGLWHRNASGADFVRGLAQNRMTNIGVGPLDANGRRTIFLAYDRSSNFPNNARSPIVHHWTVSGAPPSSAPTTTADPTTGWRIGTVNAGWGTNTAARDDDIWLGSHFDTLAGNLHTRFLPSPTDTNQCWTDGYSPAWATQDRGLNWSMSTAGYGGFSGQDMAFHPTNKDRIAIAASDIPIGITYDGFRSAMLRSHVVAIRDQIMTLTADGVLHHGRAAMWMGTNNVVFSNGGTTGTQSLARYSAGTSISGQAQFPDSLANIAGHAGEGLTAAQGGGTYNLTFAEASAQETNVGYIGPLRTTDGGVTFARLGRNVIGVSRQNGDKIYGISDGVISVSTNRGANWTTYFDAGTITNPGERHVYRLSPHDDAAMLLRDDGNVGADLPRQEDVRLVRGAVGSVQVTSLGLVAAAGWRSDIPCRMDSIGWCPLDPLTIYVGVMTNYGLSRVWRGKLNADWKNDNWAAGTYAIGAKRVHLGKVWSAAAANTTGVPGTSGWTDLGALCVWSDMTGNFPRTPHRAAIRVHPITGDVFAMCGQGIFVHAPSTGLTAASLYNNAAIPFA